MQQAQLKACAVHLADQAHARTVRTHQRAQLAAAEGCAQLFDTARQLVCQVARAGASVLEHTEQKLLAQRPTCQRCRPATVHI